jgi:hypothetical protein
MARIALATCAELPMLDDAERRVLAPLAARGVDATPVVWDDPSVDWSAYDVVVLRSTWDYSQRRDQFLAWADSVPSLLNPADVVRWNTDKRYLRDLHQAGVPVVATSWIEPGERAVVPGEGGEEQPALARADEYVVKPAVSAGSIDTGRYRRGDAQHRSLALEHIERVTGRGGTVMIQPYLSAVDAFGETAMLYIGGEFSHAIRKGPMLDGPDRGAQGLFRPELITPRTPSDLEHKVAELTLASIPGGAQLLYARVDLIPGADGTPIVLELELTEPSLFLEHDPGAAERFAAAIAACC